ncbi:putative PH domain-containing protein [Cyphellophora attinorum]|uniref:Putative PH domain-containing protein n=1 Tax=Cyphellophora attinorum TaxID=1664694 RepID=A0A0N1P1D4_9EURO|nr:putative PH domain-containing protein [Phialophora attinorum]KPI43640.1 putative PH domain-containing protein [Phialophora attinorum]
MGPFQWFLFVYVLGGLTFVPLLLAVALYIGWRTLPVEEPNAAKAKANDPGQLTRSGDEKLVFKTATDDLAEKFHRKHDSDVAAGYFAVCREWIPGGVNGKPPDRLTPAGEEISKESPSVYQTMYRSLFDRSQKPTIEPQKDGAGKSTKRANNIFYVVLRHGHLMLYDDIQQLEVRYVISLDYHDVDIYGGSEEPLPEGELWVKRHAIRMTRKASKGFTEKPSLPFFLFSENLSEKEDFYHALLKNQERSVPDAPVAEDFDTSFIVSLVQKLHSSEEQLQTRWLNAFVGRLFLATYKTPEMEDFIRAKLTKKISRVKKPTFVTRISLHKIDTGSGAPFLTNPRLKDLTVNGDCVAEMDVEYTGGFRIEIGATAGSIWGHMLLRLKPPPSNRLWFTFEKMPQMDLALEPIVSSRKITYGIILSAMESRIREVFAESLVLPFWDDIPFLDTTGQKHRGGIWKREKKDNDVEIPDETPEDEGETAAGTAEDMKAIKQDDRNWSMPALAGGSGDQSARPGDRRSIASLPGADGTTAEEEKTPPAKVPRILRTPSFGNVADPKVTANHADSDYTKSDGSSEATPKREAAAFLKDLSARSPPESHEGSPPKESAMAEALSKGRSGSSASKASVDSTTAAPRDSTIELPKTMRGIDSNSSSRPATPADPSRESKRSSTYDESKPNKTLVQQARSMTAADRKQALASATAAAQKWGSSLGWGVLKNKKEAAGTDQASRNNEPPTPTAPMGRGQPLPPPGQPLPRPNKPNNLMSNIPFMASKKPTLPKRSDTNAATSVSPKPSPQLKPSQPPPLPHRRRRRSTKHSLDQSDGGDDLLVVEAPTESAPNSPQVERNINRDSFFGHGEHADDLPPDYSGSGYGLDRADSPPPQRVSNARRQDMAQASHDPSSTKNAPSESSTPDLSDKEVALSQRPAAPALPPRAVAPAAVEDEMQLPRPPPPARTGSDTSGDSPRLSRIPSPSPSRSATSKGRKALGLNKKSSNLSLGARSATPDAG